MPDQPRAYLNGRFLPAAEASIALCDAGFAMGVTVTEQLRTFGGRLMHVEAHLARFERSLQVVGLSAGRTMQELSAIAKELARHNHPLLAEGDDLSVVLFVTPGWQRSLSGGHASEPTVCVHTTPTAFSLWAKKYEQGERLQTTDVRQVPAECWPTDVKCRSRMHYYLADRQASQRQPGARALITDLEGHVTETSTANVVVYRRDQGLLTPPRRRVLPGITLATTAKLAEEEGIAWQETDLVPADFHAADEVWLTSTPFALLPVVELNGEPIGAGTPGPLYRRLLKRWNDHVGLDLAEQARQFAER